MRRVVGARGLLSAWLLFACASCGSSGKPVPSWNSAKEVKGKIEDTWKLEDKGLAVEAEIKRHPEGMTLKLIVQSKGRKLGYDEVRAFWDNEELKIRGLRSGEMRTRDAGDGAWRAELELACKVHKWPDKDVVYVAVGPGVWKLLVEL